MSPRRREGRGRRGREAALEQACGPSSYSAICMAAAEEEAAAEGAGPRVEGLTGLEGGMLLEWAEMEVGAQATQSPTKD